MLSELTVIIKGESDTYKQKILVYDDLINYDILKFHVNQTRENYRGDINQISAKINIEVQ